MRVQREVVSVPLPEPMYLVRDAERKQVYTNITVCAAYVWDVDAEKFGACPKQYLRGMDPLTLMMEAVNQDFIPVRLVDKA